MQVRVTRYVHTAFRPRVLSSHFIPAMNKKKGKERAKNKKKNKRKRVYRRRYIRRRANSRVSELSSLSFRIKTNISLLRGIILRGRGRKDTEDLTRAEELSGKSPARILPAERKKKSKRKERAERRQISEECTYWKWNKAEDLRRAARLLRQSSCFVNCTVFPRSS